MANEALQIYKKMTLSEESDWAQGTSTEGTKLLPLRENGIAIGLAPQIIKPTRIQAQADHKYSVLGTLAPKLLAPTFGFPTGIGLKLLKVGFGQVTSTEVASFTVSTGSNDKINFTEDGGAEKTATLTAGTYKMGTTSATALTLCKEIKDQLEASNDTAATYTVTFSTSTKLLTITKNSGVFVLKFSTGANAATSARTLLGFGSVDTSSAIAATAGTAVEIVYDHVFEPLDAITYGLSAGLTAQMVMATGKVYDVLDCVVDVLKFSYKPNQELWIDAELEGRKPQDSAHDLSGLTDPASTAHPLLYSQLAFTVGGSSRSITSLEVNFANNYKKDLFVNSQYRSKFVRNGFRDITGAFTLDLADSIAYGIYDAFIAGTQPALVATWTGASNGIKTGFSYTVTMNLYKVQYNLEAVPGGGGAAAPDAPIPFIGLHDGTNGSLKVTVRNNEASI